MDNGETIYFSPRSMAIAVLSTIAFALWSFSNLRKQSNERKTEKAAKPPFGLLPRLEQRWYFCGIDTILQNIRDLRNHNASLRALERHRRHGPTYVSKALNQSTIHTIDTANILRMTTHNFDHWGRGDWAKIIARYMGKGILVNDLQDWHASRTMLKPLFRRNKAADLALFERHVDGWIEYLRQFEDEHVDFRRAVQIVVLDITTEMLCGQSAQSLANAAEKGVKKSKESTLLDLIDDIEPYGNIAIELNVLSLPLFIWDYRRIMRLVRGIQAFFHGAIEETVQLQGARAESPAKEPTVIEQMLSDGLRFDQVQGELQNIFFAAFDTTTALITNLFDSVARDAEIQHRLHVELTREIGSTGRLDENTLARLIYLRATIFETLRLHSPVTSHTRKARIDTTLPSGGAGESIFIPKGTTVVWSTYALNRSLGICDLKDCTQFRPDRWLQQDANGRLTLRVDNDFMPFGSGPRNCLGQQFALQLVAYVSARLLDAFSKVEIEHPEREFEEAAAVTYYNGLKTRIKLQT